MYLLALQFQGYHIETKGCIQDAIIFDVPIAMGVATQEAYQPTLAALEVPFQSKLPTLPAIHVVGQQTAKNFAGWPLGILHTHPAPYGMGHVVGECQDICTFACTLQYINQPLQLLVVEGVVVLAKRLCPLAVQEDDADVLFGQVVVAISLAFCDVQVAVGILLILLLRPNHGCLVYKSIRRGKVPSAGESA